MKVCIREHVVPSFSDQPIAVGTLWADDSPYVVELDCFAEVLDDKPAEAEKPSWPVKKSGAKKKSG